MHFPVKVHKYVYTKCSILSFTYTIDFVIDNQLHYMLFVAHIDYPIIASL